MNAFNDRDGVSFYAFREIKLLQMLAGAYKEDSKTCPILDCFFVEEDSTVCIVMEYLDGLSLYTELRAGRKFVDSEEEEA